MLRFSETFPSPNSFGNASSAHNQDAVTFLYESVGHYRWSHVSLSRLNLHPLLTPLKSVFHLNLSTEAVLVKVSNNPLIPSPVATE